MSRMKQKYLDIVPALREECGISNPMETPKLEKIVISVGAGDKISCQPGRPMGPQAFHLVKKE